MACADLDHLVFVPRGNAALTRRAGKHSKLRAVVVRFSRKRKRYERQGILVEEEALNRAERECLADSEARALARERAANYRERTDAQYLGQFAGRVKELFPGCPTEESHRIAKHACLRNSGRIGRSASAKQFEAPSIELAVRAHIRHEHTPYDHLLSRGNDRQECRMEVAAMVEEVLSSWLRQPTP